MRKLISFLLGLLIIGLLIFLGFKTTEDNSLVIWFGLATAFLAPSGMRLIQNAFLTIDKDDVLIKKLSKIPQINQLMEKASTVEEKINVLEKERDHLVETVKLEAKTQFLKSKKDFLVSEATRLLSQFDIIEDDLKKIDISISKSPMSEEILRLRQLISSEQRGDIILNLFGSEFTILRSFLEATPFYILFEYINLIRRIGKKRNLK